MNFGKLIPAALAVAVFIFLVDYLFYGVLMTEFFTPIAGQLESPRFLYLIIANLIFGFFFVHFYLCCHGGSSKVAEGFKHGAFMALFVFGVMNFFMYSLYDFAPLSEYLIDLVYRIIQCGIAGIIVAYITGLPDDGDREGVKNTGGAAAPPPPTPVGGN